MSHDFVQELFSRLPEAARSVLLDTVIEGLELAQATLDELAEAVSGLVAADTGGTETTTQQQKYQYIIDHSNESELRQYGLASVKAFLLGDDDVLNALYATKVEENRGTDSPWDFWQK